MQDSCARNVEYSPAYFTIYYHYYEYCAWAHGGLYFNDQ